MSFYFRDRPKFGDRLRGKSGDELLQEIKQQFDEDSKSFFEPTNRTTRDPFERHSAFSRGFPFDDDSFGRRSDIRAHLDDLAARHPEFADHLLGPAWGDVPLRSSFYNRNRDAAHPGRRQDNHQQSYSDEDARSQASGSSGTSGSSSHNETDSGHNDRAEHSPSFEQSKRRNQIPQYGLRNTVDIGQHHHNMENADKGNRGQRSMSAPPENRQPAAAQQQEQPQAQPQVAQSQPQGQRYVSRIDITPQYNQPQQAQQQQPSSHQQPQQSAQAEAQAQAQPQSQSQPQAQAQQKTQQQQANVRHIPIFVEGRDEPVLPRSFDEPPTSFRREPSPTQFNRAHFQTRSPFGRDFGARHQWPPHFQDSFYSIPGEFEQVPRRQPQTHSFQQHPRQQQYSTEKHPQQHPQYNERQPQQHYEQPKQQRPQQHCQAHAQPQSQSHPQPQAQQQQQQEQPKPKPSIPKDPLERVDLVQKEVDALAEQVKQYSGNSRSDKQYIYLDEMLTRELIKLDDIETEGRDNVRQARKNAIKTIQETISLLESKAPLPSQQASSEEQQDNKQEDQGQVSCNAMEAGQPEMMEVDQKQEDQPQNREPIPLPPGPSSPIKKSEECENASLEKVESTPNDQTAATNPVQPGQTSCEPMDTTSTGPETAAMDVPQSPPPAETKATEVEPMAEAAVAEDRKQENAVEEKGGEECKVESNVVTKVENGEKKPEPVVERQNSTENSSKKKKNESVPGAEVKVADENIPGEKQESGGAECPEQKAEKMEVDGEIKQSAKSQKKGKRTRKQTAAAPVSDKPIPLPAPQTNTTEASTK